MTDVDTSCTTMSYVRFPKYMCSHVPKLVGIDVLHSNLVEADRSTNSYCASLKSIDINPWLDQRSMKNTEYTYLFGSKLLPTGKVLEYKH